MKRWIAAAVMLTGLVWVGLVWATVALGAGGARTGPTIFGANEDQPKYTQDYGASIYDQMAAIGLTENVMSVKWDTATPGEIPNRARIAEAIEVAKARGIKVVLAIYPLKARAVADNGAQGFIDFCGLVADAFPDASAYIVGNEPNQPRFWQPQFGAKGAQVSAAAVMRVLAGCYDKLHPTGKLVVGVGLSPRGNDNPTARTNRSTSPVRFIAALGAAYRRSGRTEPLMDAFSFHPYPNVNTDPPSVGYRWPNAGVSNYARIKQALWDAFNGTAQLDVERGLPLWIDEAGWQVNTNGLVGYTGSENVPTVDEATQAALPRAADPPRRVRPGRRDPASLPLDRRHRPRRRLPERPVPSRRDREAGVRPGRQGGGRDRRRRALSGDTGVLAASDDHRAREGRLRRCGRPAAEPDQVPDRRLGGRGHRGDLRARSRGRPRDLGGGTGGRSARARGDDEHEHAARPRSRDRTRRPSRHMEARQATGLPPPAPRALDARPRPGVLRLRGLPRGRDQPLPDGVLRQPRLPGGHGGRGARAARGQDRQRGSSAPGERAAQGEGECAPRHEGRSLVRVLARDDADARERRQ